MFSFCRESDHERGSTMTDFMREEKRQKQMEAIAEDLFNNAKVPGPEPFVSRACFNFEPCANGGIFSPRKEQPLEVRFTPYSPATDDESQAGSRRSPLYALCMLIC